MTESTDATVATFQIHASCVEEFNAIQKRLADAMAARQQAKDAKVAAGVKHSKAIIAQTKIIQVETKALAAVLRDSERARCLAKGA